MKTFFINLAFLALSASAFAQGSLIVFAENGERFTLHLNGKQVNLTPDANARFDGINTEFVQTRIVFEDAANGEFSKGVMVAPDKEVTYSVRRNNKGSWVYRFVSEAPAGSTTPAVVQTPMDGDGSMNRSNPSGNLNGGVNSSSSSTTTTTTTTGTTGNPNNGSVSFSFGVNANDMGVGMNMNVNDGIGGGNVNMSGTTTTTTTISSQGNMEENHDAGWEENDSPAPSGSTSGKYEMAEKDIYCLNGMWDSEYKQGLATIKDQSFEADMLNSAKRMADSKCFNIAQVRGVLDLFTYDESKLEFAIYVYTKNGRQDREDYFNLSNAFTYSGTKGQFDEFLKWARSNVK